MLVLVAGLDPLVVKGGTAEFAAGHHPRVFELHIEVGRMVHMMVETRHCPLYLIPYRCSSVEYLVEFQEPTGAEANWPEHVGQIAAEVVSEEQVLNELARGIAAEAFFVVGSAKCPA